MMRKESIAQTAHLALANAKKPKELFFTNVENKMLKKITLIGEQKKVLFLPATNPIQIKATSKNPIFQL